MIDRTEDIATMLSTDELGIAATYIRQGFPEESVTVILEEPTEDVALLGDVGMSQPSPKAWIPTASAPYAANGDELVIGSVRYNVRESRPDGRGWTILNLSKDE